MSGGHDEGQPAASPGVLIVDDYAPNRTALRALLSSIAPITDVHSGERAIEEIGRRDFAVVVLDIQMPGLDGVAVAQRIRAGSHNPQVPIIFVTAMDSDAAPFVDGYAAGAVDFLRRPLDPVVLKCKVSVFVELQQRREQAAREAAARARLEAERAATAQASRLKDRLLAVLSHELRTPLTSILLWSDMMLTKPLSAEATRRGLETIDLCARREARLIDNVLEMSRLVAGTLTLEPRSLDLGELVVEAVAEVAALSSERGVRVAHTVEPGRWSGFGDRTRLRHVLYNLLENAVKFTPSGGRADVSLERGRDGFQIRVTDTGIGFAPESGPTLFAPFEQGDASSTRERGGLGMGLALAKALIELHGGVLIAASDGPGRGATFTVTLPHLRLDTAVGAS